MTVIIPVLEQSSGLAAFNSAFFYLPNITKISIIDFDI